MRITSQPKARSSLKTVLDQVCDDSDVTVIDQRDGADFEVMVCCGHYDDGRLPPPKSPPPEAVVPIQYFSAVALPQNTR